MQNRNGLGINYVILETLHQITLPTSNKNNARALVSEKICQYSPSIRQLAKFLQDKIHH